MLLTKKIDLINMNNEQREAINSQLEKLIKSIFLLSDRNSLYHPGYTQSFSNKLAWNKLYLQETYKQKIVGLLESAAFEDITSGDRKYSLIITRGGMVRKYRGLTPELLLSRVKSLFSYKIANLDARIIEIGWSIHVSGFITYRKSVTIPLPSGGGCGHAG